MFGVCERYEFPKKLKLLLQSIAIEIMKFLKMFPDISDSFNNICL